MLHSWFPKHFSYRLLAVQMGVLVTLALIPVWYRFRGIASFSTFYSAGFLIFWAMVWTAVWWLVTGMPGLWGFLQDRLRLIWVTLLMMLAVWSWLSWLWGFTRLTQPSVTVSSAIPLTLVVLFTIATACSSVKVQQAVMVVVASLLINSMIAGAQVAAQNEVGLQALGEFRVDPNESGTVIVQAGEVRWLRPYGLLPHPNMLAGFLAVGLLGAVGWTMAGSRRQWIVGSGISVLGLWSLLLTFSRAAWLGFGAGAVLLVFYLVWRSKRDRPTILKGLATGGLMMIAIGVFVMLYQPFLAARVGVGDESVELRSVSDRAVYNQIAFEVIGKAPIVGIGLGNFPWYAADYLAKTDFDLRGQPVHNIFLSAWTELGIIGLGLTLAATGLGGWLAWRAIREATGSEAIMRAALLAGVVALMIIGLFDHYPWTLPQFQLAWWGLLAVAGIRPYN